MKPLVRSTVLSLALAGALALPAAAADKVPAYRAEIPFANHGGINDWKAESRDAILIKATNGSYYRATFLAPCLPLPYSERIGFVTRGTDTLDQYGSILVKGQRCTFKTFERIPKPAKW